MDILTKMIQIKHKTNDMIFEEFGKYCKNNGIKQQNFYNPENKQQLINTIYDFIDFNFKQWEKSKNQIHVKNESRYIMDYLIGIYNLDYTPF